MGVKKQKKARRHVRFYKTCYGFREPFKVLCDGNFVHLVLQHRTGSPVDILPALLGGAAKVFVTRCVIAELKKLGEAFAGTVLAARRLNTAKCDHDPLLPAHECLEAMVGTENPEHFFVATQDVELRRKLRKVPGGALIFLHASGLVLEEPSSFQLSCTRTRDAEQRAGEYSREQQFLKERRANAKAASASAAATPANALNGDLDLQRRTLLDSERVTEEDERENQEEEVQVNQEFSNVGRIPRTKRKRAKGPNPLSCKKKKQTTTSGGAIAREQGVLREGDTAAKGGGRRRHRSRGRKRTDDGITAL